MPGFNIDEINREISSKVYNYLRETADKLREELNADGYKDIIKSAVVGPYMENIQIELQDDVQVDDRQNFVQLLAQGGAVKKGDEYRTIPPSATIREALGNR